MSMDGSFGEAGKRKLGRFGAILLAGAAGIFLDDPRLQAAQWDPSLEPLDCIVTPSETVEVAVDGEGLIEELAVSRGDLVEEGQFLAKLESKIEEANLAIAKARLNHAASLEAAKAEMQFKERQLERSRRLLERNHMSRSDFDIVEAEFMVARLRVREAEENRALARLEFERAKRLLERRGVHSPIKGIVVDRLVSRGEYVDSAQLFVLAKTDPLHVEIIAPSNLLNSVAVGMTARIALEGQHEGAVHLAKVTAVDKIVDASSGTFRIRLDLPNGDGKIPAGLRCSATFSGS